jgi:hypothetical protein
MSSRIKKIENTFFGGRHLSTEDRVVVNINVHNEINKVYTPGEVARSGIFKFKTLYLYEINVGKQIINMVFEKLKTEEFETIIEIDITVSIDPYKKESIKRFFLYENDELKILRGHIHRLLLEYVNCYSFDVIQSRLVDLNTYLNESNKDVSFQCSYKVENFSVIRLDLVDQSYSDEKRKAKKNKKLFDDKLEELNNELQLKNKKMIFDIDARQRLAEIYRNADGTFDEKTIALNSLINELGKSSSDKDIIKSLIVLLKSSKEDSLGSSIKTVINFVKNLI